MLIADSVQDVEELMGLPPEKVLLKWMNFHLKKAGFKKQVTNFSTDLKVRRVKSKKSDVFVTLRLTDCHKYCSMYACTSTGIRERVSFPLSIVHRHVFPSHCSLPAPK